MTGLLTSSCSATAAMGRTQAEWRNNELINERSAEFGCAALPKADVQYVEQSRLLFALLDWLRAAGPKFSNV